MELFSEKKLTSLYSHGKSLFEMSKEFNCSVHKIKYWMDKYKIKRRSISDALYIKNNPLGDPFKIKKFLNKDEKFLFGLGLGIYWGEGNKVTPNSIRVANTDLNMIKSFINFLKVICQINENKLHFSLVCFNDSDILKVKKFWSESLRINEDRFGKVVQIAPQGKGNYRRKSEYGVCTVSFHNTKLKTWIMKQIKLQCLPG